MLQTISNSNKRRSFELYIQQKTLEEKKIKMFLVQQIKQANKETNNSTHDTSESQTFASEIKAMFCWEGCGLLTWVSSDEVRT